MDLLVLLAAAFTALGVFSAAVALQTAAGDTRNSVRTRMLDTGNAHSIERLQLIVPRLASLSPRGEKTALLLEQAGVAFTVTEFLLLRTAVGVGLAILFLFVSSALDASSTIGIVAAVIGFLVGYWLPAHHMRDRKAKRLRKLEDELLDALVSTSKSLKAGVGLTQALEYAGKEAADPLGQELARIVRELQLGADIEDVLDQANRRLASSDFEILSAAIVIQRRVGGNLSEILNNTANTIRERKAIRNELNALTAKQRLQGNASALIPVLVAAFFFFVNHDTARLLFTTTTGHIALAVAIFFEVLGIWMVRHFSKIEV
jgi:tight adherence protein B